MNWNEVAFKSYSAEDCKKRFNNHLKHVRRYRTLIEIANDMEINIKKCPVKKPLNSYQLFIQDQLSNAKSSGDFVRLWFYSFHFQSWKLRVDYKFYLLILQAETMKNISSLYKNLPPEEMNVYIQKAELLRQEYRLKKLEFL